MKTSDRPTVEDGSAELQQWGSEPKLNALDSLMWRTENAPSASWTGVVVHLLDTTPTWERLLKAHEWVIRAVPRFAERVIEPLVPVGPPLWSADDSFDLAYHLRRTSLPAPGTMAQLLEVAQQLAVTPLDRNRPPWMALFVEGLEGGRSAYVLQAHHVLMDGGAAAQLYSRVLGRDPDSSSSALPVAVKRPRYTRASAAVTDAGSLVKGLGALERSLRHSVSRAIAKPAMTATYAKSMLRVASPPPASTSSLFGTGTRTKWRFGTLECDLATLKAAGKAVDGTVNDAFVAAVLGGLRHYHLKLGLELDDIPISMPVSVRRDGDPMGGNRFTGAFFSAPSSIADPADRIRAMRERVATVRNEPALDFINTVTPVFNLIPAQLVEATLSKLTAGAAITTSSWPGLTTKMFMAGAAFERMFVFGPLPGTAMCAAMNSHAGVCCIGLNADGDVFTDLDTLWACMQRGLDEVLELACT